MSGAMDRCTIIMLRALVLAQLLLGQALAQTASPSNDTASLAAAPDFVMNTLLNNMNTTFSISPLTSPAGLTGTNAQLRAIDPTGPLYLTNGSSVDNLLSGDIAYISCEASDYSGLVDAGRTISIAANHDPSAIVLYSTRASRCDYTSGDMMYSSLYTMTDANSSSNLLLGLKRANPSDPNASIYVDLSATNNTDSDTGSTNVLGRSPTTAVAMIILYSITGIITALFLIIIVVGAVRAHRHPERYGPRRIAGRPRQSRAKGIARAMLETIPIVKFGDLEEENKPQEQGRDVELGRVASSQQNESSQQQRTSVEASRAEGETSTDASRKEAKSDDSAAPKGTLETGTPAVDSGLACSVCVEDFVKGQDIRVLPCKHKFHPDCIDPWLLNVSGTCPLCRVDLRPTASNGSEVDELTLDPISPEGTPAAGASGEAGIEEGIRRNRRSRIMSILNIGHMRDATPEERIDALRRLREEGLLHPDASGSRNRRRFSHRLSRAFGSRPSSALVNSRPVSEVPDMATTAPAQNENALPVADQERTSSTQHEPNTTPPDRDAIVEPPSSPPLERLNTIPSNNSVPESQVEKQLESLERGESEAGPSSKK